jgi:hypothetical protein
MTRPLVAPNWDLNDLSSHLQVRSHTPQIDRDGA